MAFIEFPEKIDPIAVWGAILSTFLAFREIWKTRTQIEVSYNYWEYRNWKYDNNQEYI